MLGRPRDLITHRAPACRWHAAAEEQAQCAGCGDVIAAGAASILAGGSREEARRPLARGLRGRPQAEPRREPARCLLRRGGAPQPAGQPVLARGGRGARGADDQPLPLLRVRAPARRQHQQHDPLSACHCKPPSRCSAPLRWGRGCATACVRALRGPRWGRMVAGQLPALVNGSMSQQGTVRERCTRCARSPGGLLAACKVVATFSILATTF